MSSLNEISNSHPKILRETLMNALFNCILKLHDLDIFFSGLLGCFDHFNKLLGKDPSKLLGNYGIYI